MYLGILPDVSFTLTNRVIYLCDVSSQPTNGQFGLCYEQLGVRCWFDIPPLDSLAHSPNLGEMGKCRENVRVPSFGESWCMIK